MGVLIIKALLLGVALGCSFCMGATVNTMDSVAILRMDIGFYVGVILNYILGPTEVLVMPSTSKVLPN